MASSESYIIIHVLENELKLTELCDYIHIPMC